MRKDGFPYIFDIQRFSIHDGQGIRTVMFTKGCPLSCMWCQNPESQKSNAEVAFYYENCTDCKKCIENCPNNAINPITKISNFSICTQCGICIDACENNVRRIIGKKLSKKEIIKELLADIDFFHNSNGGVTFSGGEPFMHIEFLYDIVKELKASNIHINVETCGYFNIDKVKKILPYIDMIFFDIKHLNNELHKKFAGQENKIIFNNFNILNAIFKNIQIRIPLIPGINDNEEHIKLICDFLIEKGYNSVHLLPYHSLGNSKLIRIDSRKEPFKAKTHDKEEIRIIQAQFLRYNIKSIVYE